MPFDEEKLATLTATSEEHLDKEEIAERLGVTIRTVERLIEAFAKPLKRNRRRKSRKWLYLWADVLYCARIHTGLEKEYVPSAAIRKAYTKQRAHELEAEIERLKKMIPLLETGNNIPNNNAGATPRIEK